MELSDMKQTDFLVVEVNELPENLFKDDHIVVISTMNCVLSTIGEEKLEQENIQFINTNKESQYYRSSIVFKKMYDRYYQCVQEINLCNNKRHGYQYDYDDTRLFHNPSSSDFSSCHTVQYYEHGKKISETQRHNDGIIVKKDFKKNVTTQFQENKKHKIVITKLDNCEKTNKKAQKTLDTIRWADKLRFLFTKDHLSPEERFDQQVKKTAKKLGLG